MMKGTKCRREVQWYNKSQYVQERTSGFMTKGNMCRGRVKGIMKGSKGRKGLQGYDKSQYLQ